MMHQATPSQTSGLSLPQIQFPERLRILNSDPARRRVVTGLEIDSGALLILTLGNPAHFQFQIAGGEEDLSFRIAQKGQAVAAARLYRDPMRGGSHLGLDVEPEFRGLGLGVLTFIISARMNYLLTNQPLHSEPRQLSPAAEAVWDSLVVKKLAMRRGYKDYSFRPHAVESEAFSGLFDVMLKVQSQAKVISTASFFKWPRIKPEAIRKNLSGKLKPYEYWLRCD